MKNYKFKVKDLKKKDKELRKIFKKCNKCGQVKFIEKFSKDKNRKDGRRNQCIRCRDYRYEITCEVCKIKFKGKKGQRFCSNKCSSKTKERKIEFVCEWCGEKSKVGEFAYNSNNNHFCSKKCYYDYCDSKRSILNCDNCNKQYSEIISKYKLSNYHYCSNKCRNEHQRGEYSSNYNPNLTQEERENKRRIEGYNDFIKNVYKRDNYTCQCCSKVGNKLNAHHIYGYSEYKELRINVDNGITLCEECHKSYHKQYGYNNNNWKDFRRFLIDKWEETNNSQLINIIENINLRLKNKNFNEVA